jgi:predicted transposase YbfD/YdcC
MIASFISRKKLEMDEQIPGFIDFFKQVPDHRIERHKLHAVEEILLVTFCGVIAGCDGWDDLELFGKTKLDYLRQYLPFKNGAPSDDTLRRFFRALDPEKFEACFIQWVRSFQINLEEKIVAIDGKTSRRSFDGGDGAMHMISAFASEIGIVLGQLKVDGKSNEITAIPQLLEILDLESATVTIDSMGAQTKIVEKIIEKKANYVLGLKGNQGTLHDDVQLLFNNKPAKTTFFSTESIEKGHGRIEKRVCTVTDDIDWLRSEHSHWKDLRSVVEIESTRDIKGQVSVEKRYYISSHQAQPDIIGNAVRQHWGIENKLHWVLDISFGDDQSRIRKGNAPRNMAVVKKTALNLLQIIKKERPRVSLKRMRKLAGWDHGFLDTVLTAKF